MGSTRELGCEYRFAEMPAFQNFLDRFNRSRNTKDTEPTALATPYDSTETNDNGPVDEEPINTSKQDKKNDKKNAKAKLKEEKKKEKKERKLRKDEEKKDGKKKKKK